MQQSNKKVLEERLVGFLSQNGHHINLSECNIIIRIDENDEKDLKTNMEQIINFWILPKVLNKKLRLKRAIDVLVTALNEIPIWIAVEVVQNNLYLTISKRYRKLKDVDTWHNGNLFAPFLTDVPNINDNLKIVEFQFAYPAGMEENQQIFCTEFDEIRNVLNLGEIEFPEIDTLIWENVENPKANILKINSKTYEDQYILIDLWNSDQINVMNMYFRTKGAISDFILRSLYRWNDRVWQDGGPKPTILDYVATDSLRSNGRSIIEFETIREV